MLHNLLIMVFKSGEIRTGDHTPTGSHKMRREALGTWFKEDYQDFKDLEDPPRQLPQNHHKNRKYPRFVQLKNSLIRCADHCKDWTGGCDKKCQRKYERQKAKKSTTKTSTTTEAATTEAYYYTTATTAWEITTTTASTVPYSTTPQPTTTTTTTKKTLPTKATGIEMGRESSKRKLIKVKNRCQLIGQSPRKS